MENNSESSTTQSYAESHLGLLRSKRGCWHTAARQRMRVDWHSPSVEFCSLASMCRVRVWQTHSCYTATVPGKSGPDPACAVAGMKLKGAEDTNSRARKLPYFHAFQQLWWQGDSVMTGTHQRMEQTWKAPIKTWQFPRFPGGNMHCLQPHNPSHFHSMRGLSGIGVRRASYYSFL